MNDNAVFQCASNLGVFWVNFGGDGAYRLYTAKDRSGGEPSLNVFLAKYATRAEAVRGARGHAGMVITGHTATDFDRDDVARQMREYYEASKPHPRRAIDDITADNLMLGLLEIAERGMKS